VLIVLGLVTQASAAKLDANEMHERYWSLTDARDAIVAGELDKAKQVAKSMRAASTDKRVPRKWRDHMSELDRATAAIETAKDLDAASLAVANAAVACGSCHEATKGGPNLVGAGNVPPQDWEEGQNMALHRWSMDWMWLGLLDDSDAAWKRGASELGNQPLMFKFPAELEGMEDRAALEKKVYDLAEFATISEPGQRGEVFGILVATCSECHSKMAAHRDQLAAEAEAEQAAADEIDETDEE